MRFPSGFCVAVEWEKLPTEEDFGSFRFHVFRGGAAPQDPGAISVILWMPGMGHGSSPVSVEQLGPGEYRARDVFFTMRGEWEIRFQRREGQDERDQAVLPYRF